MVFVLDNKGIDHRGLYLKDESVDVAAFEVAFFYLLYLDFVV